MSSGGSPSPLREQQVDAESVEPPSLTGLSDSIAFAISANPHLLIVIHSGAKSLGRRVFAAGAIPLETEVWLSEAAKQNANDNSQSISRRGQSDHDASRSTSSDGRIEWARHPLNEEYITMTSE